MVGENTNHREMVGENTNHREMVGENTNHREESHYKIKFLAKK
jgi:hypothetical protein